MSPARLATDPRSESVAVIGSGVAGLITAHTLLRDGFTDVRILSRDAQVGGVWAANRIYPGLYLNNVHGEYRLSQLEMPLSTATGGRLTGDDMARYIEAYAEKFLQGKIESGVEVEYIRRNSCGAGWILDVHDLRSSKRERKTFGRIVVCTGGCSTPRMPARLNSDAAAAAGFQGLVFHSADFGARLQDLLASAAAVDDDSDLAPAPAPVVVVGGGKSAQDICAYLANEGRRVAMICHNLDAFTAGPRPLPNFIRKSRLLSLFSPHIHLRTSLERFLHTTWIGKKIVDFMWHGLAQSSFDAAKIAPDSPLRNTVLPFWHIRVNDEGVPRLNGFHALASSGKIDVLTATHAVGFGQDGQSVVLEDGRFIPASAVVLATGYQSSWSSLFSSSTTDELGLHPREAETNTASQWNYTTLVNGPPLHPDARRWSSSVYRGLVPAANITRRDFAVNGACISPNNGYTVE
ncbi:FAD/NAD(P)-binding domain-containing protein [Pilatotrama ljubarskyi]|nr:FAD/NAD(P)-binding domain-containing protein [Pilatotrama ljubarskyi]